ncbi:hypothetical protein KUTeg_013771 [Tegillarca granosa]|uniref:Uncharacterized protein n=1 Tax=Tegillarca granosa TaxID=220873 RepID=A0ABQ9EY25_TEGGR|nr:hypothetical protein KUTeg_013771 [Tegillarca granosa]
MELKLSFIIFAWFVMIGLVSCENPNCNFSTFDVQSEFNITKVRICNLYVSANRCMDDLNLMYRSSDTLYVKIDESRIDYDLELLGNGTKGDK